jgi:AcrR family transcriptional regulator
MQETKPKSITTYRQALKGRILTTAMEMFSTQGIRAVKMDDIAGRLGISKRTLYEIYENKEILLFEGLKRHVESEREQRRQYAASAVDAMDVVLFFYNQKSHELSEASPQFYEDLEKYPRVLEFLYKDRQKTEEGFLRFIDCGIREGYFRRDVNYDLVLHLFEALSTHIRIKRLYQQYSSSELSHNLLIVTLRGFCTAKGVSVLDEFLKKQSEESEKAAGGQPTKAETGQ